MKRSRRTQTTQRRRGGGAGGAAKARANRAEEARHFWGDADALDAPPPTVRPTPDASALVRSLGPPPLVGQDRAAEAYFSAVYDRAVGLATALAAANGLLETAPVEPDD